jgi:TetR/AcrR family transcriptional repressor of lmrAB and yxaGH operons
MNTTRDQIVQTACRLLEMQGYQATGLTQIIEESGAPRGSLYYYFPEGKEELVAEAIASTAEVVADRIRTSLAEVEAPGGAVKQFILTLAQHARASGYERGGPITTAALEAASTSERVREACLAAYCSWRKSFEEKVAEGGCNGERAARLAALIVAALEGAIILSRTERSVAPLEYVAEELETLIDGAAPG